MSRRNKNIIDLIINLFVVFNVIWCIFVFFTSGGDGNMIVYKWNCFKFYTIDSNVLCAIACGIMATKNIKIIRNKNETINQNLLIFKYVSVVAVLITFLVVMLFLGPTQGYAKMFEKTNIFMHGLNPIFAAISFILFESDNTDFTKNKIVWGESTVIIYGILYFVMVVILKKWADVYGFATILKWYVSFPIMIAFGYGVCFMVWKLYIMKNKNKDREVV